MPKKPRRQCAKCPWKTSTNPRDIPHGYSEDLHRALRGTIASGLDSLADGACRRMMACHESRVGKEVPCVGWIANQVGPGNNLRLRLAVMTGKIDGNVQTIGPQHERFEDTLPKDEP